MSEKLLPLSTMKVELEIIVAALSGRDALLYHLSRHDISERADDPDRLVRYLLGNPGSNLPIVPWDRCIVHSTSWRYEERQAVILTYLVYSDQAVLPGLGSKRLALAHGQGPIQKDLTRPRPEEIGETQVVMHGIRHLSHLVRGNPLMRQILSSETLQAFCSMETTRAGRIDPKLQ